MSRKYIVGFCLSITISICMLMSACSLPVVGVGGDGSTDAEGNPASNVLSVKEVPTYGDQLIIDINGGVPDFTDEEIKAAKDAYKSFGELDKMGRCTKAEASLTYKTMPDQTKEVRGDISSIHPSGWHSGMEWERMHLIAWALSGENANEKNLITGTHDCNYNAMRVLEGRTANYLENYHSRHVLYRVTPVFFGKELIARGVHMEAESVEDHGRDFSFNVYCYNVRRDGAEINYKTGTVDTSKVEGYAKKPNDKREYVLNTNSMKFHYPSCMGVKDIAEWNKKTVKATRQELINKGYDPCGLCEP